MDTVFQGDVAILSAVVGVFLPILVGVVTKELASGGLKATVLALFAAVSGIITGAVQAGGAFTQEALIAGFISWVIAVSTYYGYWKPTSVAAKVAEVTSAVGIGSEDGNSV
jgi:hypothetical protein